ncbi:hypothetical protein RI129_010088 [Pyrocoelia pectoralis]|uniref:Shugoshin C-terminal domain-containing protein n=1 Tax=Pyrocoelia pectoralis TaxID=417401 RepID=A0AAN7ZJ71_9COLE
MGRTRTRSQQVLKTETAASNTAAENVYLKEKNAELAKALAETQILNKHMLDDRNYIRKELFGATLRIKKLENYINNIDVSVRETINCIFALSGHATEIVNFVTCSRRIAETSLSNLNQTSKSQSCSMNRTQAVKPMIDGHVIYSPTINLRRVNPNSSELQSHRSTNNLQNVESDYDDDPGQDDNNLSGNNSFERRSSANRQYRHISERRALSEVNADLESNEGNSETSAHSEDIQLSINDMRRLSTVEEEQMSLSNRQNSSSNNGRSHNLPGAAGQVPLLSGVFRDVRVYLSPVDPLPHITKVRGSSKSHNFKSSDVHASRSPEAGPSSRENINMNDEVQEENVETNNSNLMNKFPKGTCSSTPITSFGCSQSTSTLNVGNSSVENHSTNTRARKRRRTTDHTNPKKLVFNKASQSDINASCLTDDDPLEGPSHLLDSTCVNKLHTLSQLGLSPISAVNPTDTVLSENRESSEGNAGTSKKQENNFVTKEKWKKGKV